MTVPSACKYSRAECEKRDRIVTIGIPGLVGLSLYLPRGGTLTMQVGLSLQLKFNSDCIEGNTGHYVVGRADLNSKMVDESP